MRRRALLAALALALAAAAPAAADGDRVAATRLPTCSDGEPFLVYIVDASADDDCDSTGGGTTEAPCLCLDGTYVAMLASGGAASDSFKTQNTPSGTDPVADSSTDTLNWTAGAGITITGDSATDTITIASTAGAITLDLGDDGGNDSTALSEIATVNDSASAFTESAADKLRIDVQRLGGPSMDVAPASAPTFSCEFDGSICSGSWVVDAGTSTPTAGTIGYLTSVTPDPIYDLTTIPGHLCVQSDESTGSRVRLQWTHTAATDATVVASVRVQNDLRGAAEGAVLVGWAVNGDSNEEAQMTMNGNAPRSRVNNNGTIDVTDGTTQEPDSWIPQPFILALWKASNVYRGGWGTDPRGLLSLLNGTDTKAGTTTMDRLSLEFSTMNDTPSNIICFDWIRMWDSIVTDFINP